MSRDVLAEPPSGASQSRVAPSTPLTSRPTWWLVGLVSLLGIFELLMATSAGSTGTRMIGLVGGVALVAAPWLNRRTWRGHRWGLLLLLLGTVPFAVVTWWTLVTPLLAVVALAIGIPLLRKHP